MLVSCASSCTFLHKDWAISPKAGGDLGATPPAGRAIHYMYMQLIMPFLCLPLTGPMKWLCCRSLPDICAQSGQAPCLASFGSCSCTAGSLHATQATGFTCAS